MRYLKYLKLIITFILLITTLVCSNTLANDQNLLFDIKMRKSLELAPYNTQLLFQDNTLNALSIINGKLLFFRENGTQWTELQRFGPHDIKFTTFEIKDLNNDGTPEIIAGTEDPGLIYLYTWDRGQWSLLSYGKYVWSTINKIIIGNLSNVGVRQFLIQNDEGYLFLLKLSDNSLDLIWKSPTVWRPIGTAVVADINNDSLDEIMVVYKTGGIAILKLQNNAVVSVWDNYPWGKVLGLTFGDWDNDRRPEVLFSTSQKLLYILGEYEGQYLYEGQFSEFDCIIEKVSFIDNLENKALITTNTAGILKILQYDDKNRMWLEKCSHNTGRAFEIIRPNHEQAIIWCSNRKIIDLTYYRPLSLRIVIEDQHHQLAPNALVFKNQIYLPPKALADFSELEFFYDESNQTFTINANDQTIAISQKEPTYVLINGVERIVLSLAPIIIDNQIYLPLDVYRNLLYLNLVYDSNNRTISFS